MLVISLLILLVSNSLTFLKKNIHAIFINRITSIVLLYSALLTFNILNFQAIGKGIGIFNGLFHITIPTQIIEILIFIIGAIILLGWPNSSSIPSQIKRVGSRENVDKFVQTKFGPEYSLIALFSVLGSSLLICSVDLISMYLSIELQSFALYILATLNKDSHSSVSAGLKYFLLGGLSSCFILLGAGLVYSYTGLTNFESLYTLFSVFNLNDANFSTGLISSTYTFSHFVLEDTEIKNGFTIGLIITIVGFLFKVSAAPFHNWSPDVYDESPSIITMWLSIMAKLSIFIFLLEFVLLDQSISSSDLFSIPLLSSGDESIFAFDLSHKVKESSTVKNLLLISSLLSLIVGTVVGLAQVKIRRLLAYSSISHVGFLLLALAINTEKSIESFSFYIIQYSLTSLNIFLILLAYGYIFHSSSKNTSVKDNEREVDYIVQLKGQFTENPILSISLAVCLLSMAGIPPLIGFFSKQFVLYSSIQNGYYFLSIVAIVVSVISASYYLKIVKIIFFDSENKKERDTDLFLPLSEVKVENDETTQTLTNSHGYVIALLTFIILLFFINPSILLYISQLIALNFF